MKNNLMIFYSLFWVFNVGAQPNSTTFIFNIGSQTIDTFGFNYDFELFTINQNSQIAIADSDFNVSLLELKQDSISLLESRNIINDRKGVSVDASLRSLCFNLDLNRIFFSSDKFLIYSWKKNKPIDELLFNGMDNQKILPTIYKNFYIIKEFEPNTPNCFFAAFYSGPDFKVTKRLEEKLWKRWKKKFHHNSWHTNLMPLPVFSRESDFDVSKDSYIAGLYEKSGALYLFDLTKNDILHYILMEEPIAYFSFGSKGHAVLVCTSGKIHKIQYDYTNNTIITVGSAVEGFDNVVYDGKSTLAFLYPRGIVLKNIDTGTEKTFFCSNVKTISFIPNSDKLMWISYNEN